MPDSRRPRRRTSTSSSASSPGRATRSAIHNGHVILNGKRAEGAVHRAVRRRRRTATSRSTITIPAGPLLHDGRQPWRFRRQPLLGTRPARSGSSAAPSPPTGRPSASASSERAAHRARRTATASRLFRFDRALGSRFVAGADEAGRGCLAGPLVAAAVLFDYERLTLADLRVAVGAQRLQAAHARRRARSSIRWSCGRRPRCRGHLALRARDRRARPAQDEPRRAERRRCGASAVDGCLCLSDGFPVPATGFDQRAGGRRRRDAAPRSRPPR